MTTRYLVLSAVGKDRPGLVNEISGRISRAGANLEDSRMAILGGEFAVILLVSGNDEQIAAVRGDGPELEEKLGLKCLFRDTVAPDGAGDFVAYQLRVSGVDHAGIVQRVSETLANAAVNVASLDSRVQFAPLSGTPMFVLEAQLHVPATTALSKLRQKLSDVCDDENLDFVLESR